MSSRLPEDPAHSQVTGAIDAERESSALQALVARVQSSRDFPTMAAAMREINRLSVADDSANLRGLSSTVQKDYALTQRLLRLVNSSAFRPAGGDPVSTVSRAIELLGINRVRALAASLVLFDAGADGARAQALREEFLRAATASAIAASVVEGGPRLAEEAGLAAMFHRLGRVLLITHMPAEAEALRRLDNTLGAHAWREAEIRRLLGTSLDEFGHAVAQGWGFPSILLQGFHRPGLDDRIPVLRSQEAQVQVACGLAAELCEAIGAAAGLGAGTLERLARRYRANLHLDEGDLLKQVRSARSQTAAFVQATGFDLTGTDFGRRLVRAASAGSPGESSSRQSADGVPAQRHGESEGVADGPAGAVPGSGGTPAGAEAAAAALRTAGLAQTLATLSGQLAEDASMNELVRTTLEGLREALGCRRVVFATREPDTAALVARQARGQISASMLSQFRVSLDDEADLLGLSTRKGVDLLITDARDAKVAPRLAGWQRLHFPAASFLLLPVLVDAQPRALIYADSDRPGGLSLDPAALSMLRGIRNQLVLALRQSRGSAAR